MEKIDFFDLNWHDAVFKSFSIKDIDTKKVNVRILGEIYKSNEDGERIDIEILFSNVLNAHILCDFKKLYSNKIAGNFNTDLFLGNSYTFMLFGGYIEIYSKKEPKCIIL